MFDKSKNIKKWFLESVNVEAFGKFYDKKLGKFKDGLNIVYGDNEAGKSTISIFIQGVLTGWPNINRSKKQLNKYSASNNNRSGSLVFANNYDENKILLSRTNNKDPEIIGSDREIEIPDKDTYETMFSLNSDRLWNLGTNEKEITSQFLTAETGTKYAPAEAMNNINQKIKNYNSKNASLKDQSIVAIDEKIEEYEDIINAYDSDKDLIIEKAKNIPILTKENDKLTTEIENLERKLDSLKNAKAKSDFIEKQIGELKQKENNIDKLIASYSNSYTNNNNDYNQNLNKIQNNNKSKKSKTVFTTIILFLCLSMGVTCFITNFNEIFSNITKIFFIASIIALIVIWLSSFKKSKKAAHEKTTETDVTSNNLELTKLQATKAQISEEIKNFIKAQQEIFNTIENVNNTNNLEFEIKNSKEKIANLYSTIDNNKQQITQMQTEIQNVDQNTINYYKQSLAIENQNKNDLLDKYIVDILCEKILREAVDEWKQTSQPQVYKDASKFLALMTNNEWTKVFQEEEKFYVSDDDMTKSLDVDKLSFSTRQQLYLALRIAILIRPESAGKNIPVICDDILVNFDHARQVGAIKAIYELSKYRQVIMFTCHKNLLDEIDKEIPLFNIVNI